MKIKIKALSVNKCWQGRRFKTPEYLAYEKELMYLLPKEYTIPEDNLFLSIEVGMSSSLSDLDNVCKPFQDILQKKYNFNDKRINKIQMYKTKVKKGEEYISFEIY